MADTTFTLGIELDSKNTTASLKDIQKELDNVSKSAKNLGQDFGKGLDGLTGKIDGITDNLKNLTSGGLRGASGAITELTAGMGLLAGAAVGTGAAFAAIGAALIANGSAMAAFAENIDEVSAKLGITADRFQVLQILTSETGTTVESLTSTYDKLGQSLTAAADGSLPMENNFRRLGIAMTDLAGLSKEQIAGLVVTNMEALGNSTQAVAAAQDILGKNFRENKAAILEAANSFDDYNKRVEHFSAKVTPDLIKAGNDQEKAFTDLKLAATGLQLEMSRGFTTMVTDMSNWAASMLKGITDVLAGFRAAKDQAAAIESITQSRRNELLKQAKDETYALDPGATLGDVNEKFKKLLAAELKAKADLVDYGNNEIKKFLRQAAVSTGTDKQVVPLKDLVKPVTAPKDKQTEEEKNIVAGINAWKNALVDLDSIIKRGVKSNNDLDDTMADVAFRMVKASHGAITLADAMKLVVANKDAFQQAMTITAENKFNERTKSISDDLNLQLSLLKQTTDVEREKVKLAYEYSRLFKDLPVEDQARMWEKAEIEISKLESKLGDISRLKVVNSLTTSMRDLSEQTEDLNFQLENYWSINRDGIVNVNSALKALERQIDPEGRGKNISDAQRAQLKQQLEIIEQKKAEIALNQELDSSYKSLGSAATDWALGTKDAINQVRLQLVRLLIIQGAKAFGTGLGSGPGGSFISGVLGGLAGARAEGGAVESGKSYLVGEKGPEIVKFNAPGYVIPNNQISAGAGKAMTYTFAPNLIVQGSVTGQTELEKMFEDFAGAMAAETQNFVISQRGHNGILAR